MHSLILGVREGRTIRQLSTALPNVAAPGFIIISTLNLILTEMFISNLIIFEMLSLKNLHYLISHNYLTIFMQVRLN